MAILGSDTNRQIVRSAMERMRDSFKREDWSETLASFESLRAMLKGERAMRVEATCLAARALAAQKDRAAARAVLKPVASVEYAKAGHYEFLARAFLDLKQYKDAARMCERAQAVREAEAAKA